MIKYHTSIKLKSSNQEDVQTLQNEMEKESFTHVAEAGNNLTSTTTIFRREGTNLQEILNATFRAVSKVSNTYSFTIISETQN